MANALSFAKSYSCTTANFGTSFSWKRASENSIVLAATRNRKYQGGFGNGFGRLPVCLESICSLDETEVTMTVPFSRCFLLLNRHENTLVHALQRVNEPVLTAYSWLECVFTFLSELQPPKEFQYLRRSLQFTASSKQFNAH